MGSDKQDEQSVIITHMWVGIRSATLILSDWPRVPTAFPEDGWFAFLIIPQTRQSISRWHLETMGAARNARTILRVPISQIAAQSRKAVGIGMLMGRGAQITSQTVTDSCLMLEPTLMVGMAS